MGKHFVKRTQCGRLWAAGAIAAGALLAGSGLFAAELNAGAQVPDRPAEDHRHLIDLGHDLFIHVWQFNDKLSGGDGLGPMFNERSCVGCHNQGGVGGAGANEKNVQLLSMVPGATTLSETDRSKQAAQVHPGLVDRPGGVVLHKFCQDYKYVAWRRERVSMANTLGSPMAYAPKIFRPDVLSADDFFNFQRAARRGRLHADPRQLGRELQQIVDIADAKGGLRNESIKLQLTERNTPTIFGAGLIDQVTDAEIEAQEARQASAGDGQRASRRNGPVGGRGGPRLVARGRVMLSRDNEAQRVSLALGGRVARLPDGRIGRFGWKGQNATLKDFTLDACAVELGLQTEGRPQALDPRHAKFTANAARQPDLDAIQCEALVSYLSDLPAPQPVEPILKDTAHIAAGRALFESVGCEDCHVQTVGVATNI